jgi:hypothetical protein
MPIPGRIAPVGEDGIKDQNSNEDVSAARRQRSSYLPSTGEKSAVRLSIVTERRSAAAGFMTGSVVR